MSDDPRFPVGKFVWPDSVTPRDREQYIGIIADTPKQLRAAVAGLSDAQLDTPYRDGGWTVRQVIHHVPESHMNSYIRFKLALTEENPVIKPYDEDAWAKLADVASTPIEVSLDLLENLHTRWVNLLRGIDEAGWNRSFVHPEIGPVTLEKNLALYAWHGRHHAAHITALRQRNGWK